MPIYHFRDHEGHTTEAIRPMDCTSIECPHCGAEAVRLGAYRVAVTLPEVDMRGKFRRYQEATAEMDYAATKVEQSTGQAVQAPPYWRMAKAQAKAMSARGEAPAVRKEQLG
jgi:hypothetical protein